MHAIHTIGATSTTRKYKIWLAPRVRVAARESASPAAAPIEVSDRIVFWEALRSPSRPVYRTFIKGRKAETSRRTAATPSMRGTTAQLEERAQKWSSLVDCARSGGDCQAGSPSGTFSSGVVAPADAGKATIDRIASGARVATA
eukprot:scaffold98767_cov32-Tisochrysis_lutea.AAC.5